MSILSRIRSIFHRPPPARAASPTFTMPTARLPTALPVAQHAALPIASHAPQFAGGLPVAQQLPEISDYGTYDPNATNNPEATRYTNPLFGAPINQWSRVQSTWLRAVRFDPYPNGVAGDLLIEFNDGFIGLWTNTANQDYLTVWHAHSKGQWLTRWSRKSDYSVVRGQLYHGAALALRVKENG